MPQTPAELFIYLEWLGRLCFAALMGLVIGYERERGGRPAGLRTHMLVALGSGLVMVTSSFLMHQGYTADISRMGAQVVSGIGFLGAGSIIKSGTGVKGLTTAATLWIVAGIGLAAGSGFFWGAGLVTLVTYVCLKVLKLLENKMISAELFSVYIPCEPDKLAELTTLVWNEKLALLKITTTNRNEYKVDIEGKAGRLKQIIQAFNSLGYAKIEIYSEHER